MKAVLEHRGTMSSKTYCQSTGAKSAVDNRGLTEPPAAAGFACSAESESCTQDAVKARTLERRCSAFVRQTEFSRDRLGRTFGVRYGRAFGNRKWSRYEVSSTLFGNYALDLF